MQMELPRLVMDGAKWTDLFEEWKPWRPDPADKVPPPVHGRWIEDTEIPGMGSLWHDRGPAAARVKLPVGPYLRTSGKTSHRAFAVRCTDAVIEAIRKNTILPVRDSFSFQAICLGEFWRIIVDHNIIIGSVWLCEIPDAEMPPEVRR